jgi:hypothetical protein
MYLGLTPPKPRRSVCQDNSDLQIKYVPVRPIVTTDYIRDEGAREEDCRPRVLAANAIQKVSSSVNAAIAADSRHIFY